MTAGLLFAFAAVSTGLGAAELVVDNRLPGGNIEFVRVESDTVHVRNEMRDTEGWWFWWSFRVCGAAGRRLTFRFEKVRGWNENVSNRGACVSLDRGETWTYSEGEPFAATEFTYTFPKGADEVWFSMCLPYGVREWESFVRRHEQDSALSVRRLCASRHGRDVPYVRIGPGQARYRVFLSSRHHCAEATATRILEGVLEAALAKDDVGDWFRRNVELLAVPMMDYDGVIEGDQGKHRKPHDYNRDYTEFIWPETRAVRDLLLAGDKNTDAFIDFHCPHYNDPRIHLMMRRHGRCEANQKAFASLVEKNAVGLVYDSRNNYPWGDKWNCDRLYASGNSSTLWATKALPGIRFSGCYEIPFSDTRPSRAAPAGTPITPANCMAFGRSVAKSIREFLSDASLGPVVSPPSPAGSVLFCQRTMSEDGGVWPVPDELANLESEFAVEFTVEAARKPKPWAGIVQARFHENGELRLPFSFSGDDRGRLYFRMDTHASVNEQCVSATRDVFDGKPHRVRATFTPSSRCANDTDVVCSVDGEEAFRIERRRGRVGFSSVFPNEIAVGRGRASFDGCVRDLRIVRLPETHDLVIYDGAPKAWSRGKLVFDGPWNLCQNGTLRVTVENTSDVADVRLVVNLGDTAESRVRQTMIPAGYIGMIDIDVCPPSPLPEVASKMKLMRTDPFMGGARDARYDASCIERLVLEHGRGATTASDDEMPTVIIRRVVALDTSKKTWPAWQTMGEKEFFPFIDRYGQFIHGAWPGKVTDDADLKDALAVESADLATHPGSGAWDRFGGWAFGPQLEATGRFRMTKWKGKWWFVNPEGHLWWSHGVVRVTPSSAVTPLDGREMYFSDLPTDDGTNPFGAFYHTQDELLRPYYDKWGWRRTYDFSSANLLRKYGANWRSIYADLSHRRLRSWCLNTIANSSDAAIRRKNRTPWIERLETRGPRCKEQKDAGDWWHVPDPYSPEFRADLRGQLERRRDELLSPWCAGVFIDNEHNWRGIGDETVREYFKVVREEIKRLDPCLLYFGCRFAGTGGDHERVARICAEFADVVSFNIYGFRLDTFSLPKGVDKPVLIGEFHFGSTADTGLFNPSLIGVSDQSARAAAYVRYVRDALGHPQIVGTHWHQFSDQATTGRFDGENFNVGFTDVCDTPYPAIRDALRRVGGQLYEIRSGN